MKARYTIQPEFALPSLNGDELIVDTDAALLEAIKAALDKSPTACVIVRREDE